MKDELKASLVALGFATAAGVGFALWTIDPEASRADLVDAGLVDAQRVVVVCEERIGRGLAKRLRRELGAGAMRPRQRYAAVARVGFCMRPGEATGNCLRPDGGVFAAAANGDIVVPSLRRTARVDELEADEADDGEVAGAVPLHDRCDVRPCSAFPGLCSSAFGVTLATPECVVPNCWTSDGGWSDSAVVDCETNATMDGGWRYAGCNVIRANRSRGSACLPSSCTVISGEPGSGL